MSSNPPVRVHGRRFRALTGGDFCVEPVDVSGHFHTGHPTTLKVRPALGVQLVTEPPHTGHHGISKLRPTIRDTPTFPFTLKAKPSAPILISTPLEMRELDATPSLRPLDANPSPLAGAENPVIEEEDKVDIPVRVPLAVVD